jgi:hypothetical protein
MLIVQSSGTGPGVESDMLAVQLLRTNVYTISLSYSFELWLSFYLLSCVYIHLRQFWRHEILKVVKKTHTCSKPIYLSYLKPKFEYPELISHNCDHFRIFVHAFRNLLVKQIKLYL